MRKMKILEFISLFVGLILINAYIIVPLIVENKEKLELISKGNLAEDILLRNAYVGGKMVGFDITEMIERVAEIRESVNEKTK